MPDWIKFMQTNDRPLLVNSASPMTVIPGKTDGESFLYVGQGDDSAGYSVKGDTESLALALGAVTLG